MVTRGERPSCPNAASSQPGAALFGVVVEAGQVAFIHPKIPVRHELLKHLEANGINVEGRLRLTGECLSTRCVQWEGGECSLARNVVNSVNLPKESWNAELPDCGIRDSCRWHLQHGVTPCQACTWVIRQPAIAGD